jgi:hypothetical protein
LAPAEATHIIGEVLAVIATWRARASKAHISVADIEEMGHLFITSQ